MAKTELKKAPKKAAKKEKAKRTYCTDVREKIKRGDKWKLQLLVDDDNANNILDEIDNSLGGGEYNKVINSIIRLHFKNKK